MLDNTMYFEGSHDNVGVPLLVAEAYLYWWQKLFGRIPQVFSIGPHEILETQPCVVAAHDVTNRIDKERLRRAGREDTVQRGRAHT